MTDEEMKRMELDGTGDAPQAPGDTPPAGPPAGGGDTGPQESPKPQTKREMTIARLLRLHPDGKWDDDEALYSQIGDDYDAYDRRIRGYQDNEKKMTDLFVKDPKSAQFLVDMANGKDPWLAVINRLGIEGITDLINDPEKQEAYAEANKKYVERLAKERELETTYDRNIDGSIVTIDRMQKARGLTDEQMDAAFNLVYRIANEAILGKYTEETMDLALKAVNHDADVTNAAEEARVRGRNERIEERLRKPRAGDGTPQLGGSHNAPHRRAQQSMFDLADEAR